MSSQDQNEQKIKQINFAVNAYQSRSSIASSERLLNLYGEQSPNDSPFKVATVFNIPGYQLWNDFEVGSPVYGFQVMSDNLYVVIGLTLYQITATKTVTELGQLGTTPGPVEMTENGVQLTILTAQGSSYYYNALTNTFGQITSVNYQLSSSVTSLDGYTIFSVANSGEFFISALRDTTTYSALDVATAEALSDNIVRICTFNRQLYIFGTQSIEIWYNTGNVNFPFQRIDGALIQRGLGAKASVAIEMSGLYWIGEDKCVYTTSSYLPEKISTFAIDNILTSCDRIDDASAYIYTQAGHKFYVLTLPSANKTLVFDLITGLWHERGSLNNNGTSIGKWNCQYNVLFSNLNIVNGRQDGKLYFLDLNTYTEDGLTIIREAISATQFDNYNYETIDRLALMMDFGVGVDGNGQGVDPQIMMTFSIDGGYTWSQETQASLGVIGQYPQELFWDRLGQARSIIIKLRISDPVKTTIVAAYMKIKGGAF